MSNHLIVEYTSDYTDFNGQVRQAAETLRCNWFEFDAKTRRMIVHSGGTWYTLENVIAVKVDHE